MNADTHVDDFIALFFFLKEENQAKNKN